ncbi:AbgT family transporter [Lysobacter pythonis]|uniref:AbgT family transporter n=1 Tax=Solilutibacter pythonis TaxID=2483112 RepID=A0A3M2HYG3_9GAMM|nr:AbgT family transporter [Lysobacter pythonis]RMH94771.1 AbgT family transporter [Lysobacter pythonis]
MSGQAADAPRRASAIDRFLNIVEKGGNALPHPATLFALLALAVVALSWIASQFHISVPHPTTGETIRPVNLMTVEGLQRILDSLVTNFTSFAPLGTVLVSLIGIGVAEHSGLIGAALRKLVLTAPSFLLTPVMVFAGVMSNMASEIGYVLLVPLAGMVFLAAGRHPILGMAAAFAGVSGGYSANLLLGTIDPLLAGLSQEAARIVDAAYTVNPAANWYFMIVSTFLVTGLGWWVTERFVARRFPDAPETSNQGDEIEPISAAEKRGLVYAGVATALLTGLILWGTVPDDGFLRLAGQEKLLDSLKPFLSGIVAVIFLYGLVAGVAYGVGAGTVGSDADVINGMGKSMSTLGVYLVLTFFAAQFVAFFNWTQLGLIFAVKGADLLIQMQLPGIVLFAGFILLTALANLFMGSASAKWALMAPVFVPMFMLLGYSPELTQVGYRIGDSVTNIISPMMSYFALIIAFLQRYEPKAGIGTVIAVMLPYSIVFLIGWTVLFAFWMGFDLPIGPGAPLQYVPAGKTAA